MIRTQHYLVSAEQCDELGHLNHALALRFFERARVEWYTAAGLWGGETLHPGVKHGTVILNINVDYRAECFAGDSIEVTTRPVRRGRKSYTLAQKLAKTDGQTAIEMQSTSLVMDL